MKLKNILDLMPCDARIAINEEGQYDSDGHPSILYEGCAGSFPYSMFDLIHADVIDMFACYGSDELTACLRVEVAPV